MGLLVLKTTDVTKHLYTSYLTSVRCSACLAQGPRSIIDCVKPGIESMDESKTKLLLSAKKCISHSRLPLVRLFLGVSSLVPALGVLV